MKKLFVLLFAFILISIGFIPVVMAEAGYLQESLFLFGRRFGTDLSDFSDQGNEASFDNFPVVVDELTTDEIPNTTEPGPSVAGAEDVELEFSHFRIETPLYPQDYYWGKYLNAKAGAEELNLMPVLEPGDTVSVIGNGYITLHPSRGYVQPVNGFYYGSGLCWSISALGQMMDHANTEFIAKYGMPLFVFGAGWRAPHTHWYETYQNSNYGFGYAVLKSGSGGQDFTFQVNPEVATLPGMEDLKLKIVMEPQSDHANAYNGESVNAYVKSNKDFQLVSYKDPAALVESYKQDYIDYVREIKREISN